MKKRDIEFAIIFIAVALIIVTSFYWDNQIVKDIALMREEALTVFFIAIALASSEGIIAVFLSVILLWQYDKRKWIMPLWFTLAISSIAGFFLKLMIKRERPFQAELVSTFDLLEKANYSSWNFSFPSFQAMMVFCAVPIVSKNFPKFKYAWILFAGLVAFSRVYLGLHFLSDVIVGGIIGYFIGLIIINKEEESHFWQKTYNKVIGV